jgi:hypothetical protein
MVNHPSTRDRYKDYNWAANLEIYAGNEDNFKFRYNRKKHEVRRLIPGVYMDTIAGLNDCGDQAIIWNRG